MLRLVSIAPGTRETSARVALWSAISRISIEAEGATNFTIDSTTPPGRDTAEVATDAALLASIGVRVDDPQRLLRPIREAAGVLADLGPRVLSVDLYADRAWVAGVSDWSDEMDVLFRETAWATLQAAINDTCPNAVVDQAQARSRPLFGETGGVGRRARGGSPAS